MGLYACLVDAEESLLGEASLSSNPSRIPLRNSPNALPTDLPNSGSLLGPKRMSTTSTRTRISPNPIFPILESPSNKFHMHAQRVIRKTIRQRRKRVRIQHRAHRELIKERVPG